MLFRPILALAAIALVAGSPLRCVRSHANELPQRGWALYNNMCAVCHGRDGAGYVADRAPALANREFLASASDAYLRAAIANGRSGTTMSAWGTQHGGPLAEADIDAIISFLRTWAPGPRTQLDERPLTGDVERGSSVYARECTQCHGARGVGGTYERIGGPELLLDATNGYLRRAVQRGRPGTVMPAFESRLGAGGVEDVVALLRSWQPASAPAAALPPARLPPLPLGPVPLNPSGPEPVGFHSQGQPTPAAVIKAQLDRGARMALLDARAPSDYVRLHIQGAVSVPFYDPSPYFAALPRNTWLVCYCACPHAESGQLAHKLNEKGFTKVTVLDEGLGVWQARNYPTRGGLAP